MAKWIKQGGSGPAKVFPRQTDENTSWAGSIAATAADRNSRLANNARITPATLGTREKVQAARNGENTNANNNQNYGGGNQYAAYQAQLNSLYDQIMNRKPFQYDVNGDLLYRQMADQAMKNGALAARNAMGQAAALTGGYGNSYAEQVAAQAYQQNMTALNDNIPELYQQALNAYLAQGDQLLQQYELAAAHPGYLQAMQPTGSGGGTRAADVDYNSILQAIVNGIGSVSNAATAQDPVLYNYYDLQKYLNK